MIVWTFSEHYSQLSIKDREWNNGQDTNQADLTAFVFLLLLHQDIQQYFFHTTKYCQVIKELLKVSEITMSLDEQATLRHLSSLLPTKFLGCQTSPSHSINTMYLFHDLLLQPKEFIQQKLSKIKYYAKNTF